MFSEGLRKSGLGTNRLINSVHIRNYEAILQISNTTEVPAGVQYNRKCYQKFAMKSLLERV